MTYDCTDKDVWKKDCISLAKDMGYKGTLVMFEKTQDGEKAYIQNPFSGLVHQIGTYRDNLGGIVFN